mmetsp:Transcript_34709/g.63201  ORF Transcript_34709/g.63201 Transcript_34709/m.63201 type:complete len:623 (-) Transcript_34709:203-2071(-)
MEIKSVSHFSRLVIKMRASFGVIIISFVAALVVAKAADFDIENRYTREYGQPGQQYPWLEGKKLAEPYMASELVVKDPVDGATYTWKIAGYDGQLTGLSPSYTFEQVGTYKVSLTETLRNGDTAATAYDVVVKYVRREIRSLFDSDRDDLLDAMKILWTVDKEEGQATYGKDYVSILELLLYHLTLAGASECDHMHDGYAFMQHHSALSGLFENALQAINPSIALPYWDYVYDIEEWNNQDMETRWDFTQGELFTEDYFGSTDSNTHYIKDGRWAGINIPKISELDEDLRLVTPHNAYGHMRAPWAANSDQHLMRAQTVCGQLSTVSVEDAGRCTSLQQLFAEETFADFGFYISYMPHGRIHLLTGGVFGCDETLGGMYDIDELMDDPDFDVSYAVSLAFAMHKNLYRYGKINCDQVNEPCYCDNLGTMLEDEDSIDAFLKAALYQLNMYKFGIDTKKRLVKMLCNSGTVDGDNLQSSSSFTPEFWPIHGTVERMFQIKSLGWNGVEKFKDLEYPETGSWLTYATRHCDGHDWKDLVLDGMTTIKVDGANKFVTNKEYLELMNPHEDMGMPYIYDNLDWSYCRQEYGVDVYNMEHVTPRGTPQDFTNIWGVGGVVGGAVPQK